MSQRQLQGCEELLDDAARTRAVAVANSSVEERLHGIAPEEMLRRLSLEDRLRGLSPAERDRLRELLLK